ncbi:MAG TPA: spore coat protein, partial [Bacillota bacterium]|nr:spore coat protein [Bacillota bacterium]
MKKSLLSLAAEKYQLTVRKHSYIHDTEKTRVLSLETNQGKFILKTLYKPLSRQLFILEAENYLIKKGVHIPKTISTHGGNPYIMWEGHPY